MQQNFEILSAERDANGNPYKIIRVPCPPPLIWKITRKSPLFASFEILCPDLVKELDEVKVVLAASYLNFLVTNGAVLIPKYYKEGRPIAFKGVIWFLFFIVYVCVLLCYVLNVCFILNVVDMAMRGNVANV